MLPSRTDHSGGAVAKKKKFRPDLSDYEIYIMALADCLNEQSAFHMSKTDAVKFAIEKAVKVVLPDVVMREVMYIPVKQ